MGTEQEAKQEQAAYAKPEEKVATEEKAEEDNKKEDEESTKPPTPCILHVDLHCVGCAKKIEKCILKIRGVEGVVMDMAQNQVTLKGIVDPQAVCNIITNKTKRKPQILSPLPPAADQGQQQLNVSSQVPVPTTVELNVNMHCEACAEQLKRKILKMRGVQSVSTELGTEKVRVTGTMDPDKLVEYVYRRTKKQARILPQPQPEPDNQKEKPTDPAAAAEEENNKDEEEEEEEKKGGSDDDIENNKTEKGGDDEMMILKSDDDEEETENMQNKKTTMMYNYNNYQPLYLIDKIPPPPHLFSDENPNACCIT